VPDLDLHLDLDLIPDAATRHAVLRLLNLVEHLHSQVQTLLIENQRLKDEINRLKGEHPKPSFPKSADAKDQDTGKGKGNGSGSDAVDFSSEAERHEPKEHQKRRKLDRLTIDRTQILGLDRDTLPPDAEFKGYEDVVVQEIELRVETIRFCKAVYYSPSLHKTFTAALPEGFHGEFGPGVRSLALWLVYAGGMSQPDLHSLLNDAGLSISAGQVASLLTQNLDPLHREAQAVGRAGLASSPWQQIDETRTPVNGQNNTCNTLCNPLYSSYRTTPTKERLAVWDVLRAGEPRAFRLDEVAFAYLARAGLPQKWVRALAAIPPAPEPAGAVDEATFRSLLLEHLPRVGPQQRQRILEAGALSAYRAQKTVAVVGTLVCDDAAQFEGVTQERALCWVHEGRHYKKLCPYLAQHQKLLAEFREGFWTYYRKLLAYQRNPTPEEGERLWEEFDVVFGQRTGYDLLDERIEKTREKKKELLVVLGHPEVPLHNNASELAARRRVRKRAVSYGPRSEAGKQAWDTLQTLSETAKKVGVSFYHWLKDRVSEAYAMPSLAEVIEERAETLKLGASWDQT
jgi:regulator of replication initiation timing